MKYVEIVRPDPPRATLIPNERPSPSSLQFAEDALARATLALAREKLQEAMRLADCVICFYCGARSARSITSGQWTCGCPASKHYLGGT